MADHTSGIEALRLEGNKLLHGFAPADRTLIGSVRELSLLRQWQASPFFDREEPGGESDSVWISGTVTLQRDAITVVGSHREPVSELSLTLQPLGNAEAPERWKEPVERLLAKFEDHSLGEDGGKLVTYLRDVYSHFDERPPTL